MWWYNFDDAFHGAKAQTNLQEVSLILSFVNKIMTKQCFIPRELVTFKFFLFEVVRYSADRDSSSDWTKYDVVYQLLTLLRVFKDLSTLHQSYFVDKIKKSRSF